MDWCRLYPRASPRAGSSMTVLVEGFVPEDSLAFRSLLRCNQFRQLRVQKTTPTSTKIGKLMNPKTVKKLYLQEHDSGTSTTKSEGRVVFISTILSDHTVLANAVQNACVGMWYPSAEKREGERSFDCITYRRQEQVCPCSSLAAASMTIKGGKEFRQERQKAQLTSPFAVQALLHCRKS